MATEPLATVKIPEPSGGRFGFREALNIREPFMKARAELMPKISQAEGDIAQAKQAQAETLAAGKSEAMQQFAGAERGAKEVYQQKLEAEPLPAFIPTQDTVQDIAGLFSLIGVLGMIAGKSNAIQAMNAMNGMLEGHRKGRKDLYQQERQTFEKNFQSMLKKHEEFRREMEDAVKLAATDRDAGMQAAELAAAKAGSTIAQAQLRKGQFMDVYKWLDQSEQGVIYAQDAEQKALAAEAAERRHKETLAQQERLRLAQMAHAEEMARTRSGARGAGAAAGQIERITNAMTQVSGAIKAVSDLPITTTAPVFGQKDFKGLFTAPLSVLNQNMSKETSQMMAGRMVGVARNLASLETGGAATGLANLTDSIQAGISIPAGAKLHVALDRLAEMRRIVEDSARAALSSSKYTEDQKNLIRENVEIVKKAIPFTLEDVSDAVIASKGKSPKVAKEDRDLTFTQYVERYGVGGPPTMNSVPTEPKEGDKSTSRSGKPIVYKNGTWEYE